MQGDPPPLGVARPRHLVVPRKHRGKQDVARSAPPGGILLDVHRLPSTEIDHEVGAMNRPGHLIPSRKVGCPPQFLESFRGRRRRCEGDRLTRNLAHFSAGTSDEHTSRRNRFLTVPSQSGLVQVPHFRDVEESITTSLEAGHAANRGTFWTGLQGILKAEAASFEAAEVATTGSRKQVPHLRFGRFEIAERRQALRSITIRLRGAS